MNFPMADVFNALPVSLEQDMDPVCHVRQGLVDQHAFLATEKQGHALNALLVMLSRAQFVCRAHLEPSVEKESLARLAQ